jgi:hypothetical protein
VKNQQIWNAKFLGRMTYKQGLGLFLGGKRLVFQA